MYWLVTAFVVSFCAQWPFCMPGSTRQRLEQLVVPASDAPVRGSRAAGVNDEHLDGSRTAVHALRRRVRPPSLRYAPLLSSSRTGAGEIGHDGRAKAGP